ncbi:MAG: GPP34 family phosphoprotein [Actinobacteria bacterium]|nr:GPP34 family phosphoprotein [Actinomycetota bacterium]
MRRNLFLAEELALVAINDSGHHALGTRDQLNACLAGLLVAELVFDGHAHRGKGDDTLVLAGGRAPESQTLAAAALVVDEKGPKVKAILSHMDRGLTRHLGHGTRDAAVSGLVEAGVVAEPKSGLRTRYDVIDRGRREAIVTRLQGAVAGDGPLQPRTALLLSMTGPANLLEVVAPDRGARRHARHRIDHALEGSPFEPIGKAVRKLIAEAMAAAAG